MLTLIPVPSDLFVAKGKVILILGGSAALYFVALASTPFERNFSLNCLVLSSLSAATLWDLAGPTELFLVAFLYLSARFLLKRNSIFFLVLLIRVFLFSDYGLALLIQTFFLYCLRKWRKKTLFLLELYLTFIVFCIWLGSVMIKGLLFPLSGALAIFFFFVAASGPEHFLASLFYLLNQLFLFVYTGNKEIALFLFYVYTSFILILVMLTLIIRINKLPISKLTEDLIWILNEVKMQFFFVFGGFLYYLLYVSVCPQWVLALGETLFLQVSFLNLFHFLFVHVYKKNSNGK